MKRLLQPWVALSLALFVGLAAFPLIRPSVYLLGFLLLLFMYAALAASWNIIGGYAGYLSFGHAAFFGLGAYTTALLLFYLDWSPFLTMPLGGLLAAVFAALVGYPCLLMALFGGRLSWVGPLLGAAFLSVISEVLTIQAEAQTARIVFGLLLMGVIIFMPDGLMAYIAPWSQRFSTRLARQRETPLSAHLTKIGKDTR